MLAMVFSRACVSSGDFNHAAGESHYAFSDDGRNAFNAFGDKSPGRRTADVAKGKHTDHRSFLLITAIGGSSESPCAALPC